MDTPNERRTKWREEKEKKKQRRGRGHATRRRVEWLEARVSALSAQLAAHHEESSSTAVRDAVEAMEVKVAALSAQLAAQHEESPPTTVGDVVIEAMQEMGSKMDRAKVAIQGMRHDAAEQRILFHKTLEKARGMEVELKRASPARWELSGLPHALEREAWRDRRERALVKEKADLQQRAAGAERREKQMARDRYREVKKAAKAIKRKVSAQAKLLVVWTTMAGARKVRRQEETRLLSAAGVKRWRKRARAAVRRLRKRALEGFQLSLEHEARRRVVKSWLRRMVEFRRHRRRVLARCQRRVMEHVRHDVYDVMMEGFKVEVAEAAKMMERSKAKLAEAARESAASRDAQEKTREEILRRCQEQGESMRRHLRDGEKRTQKALEEAREEILRRQCQDGRHRDIEEEGTGEVNEEAIREKDAVAAVGPEGGELWFGGLPDAQQSRGDDTGEASHINMQKESEDAKPRTNDDLKEDEQEREASRPHCGQVQKEPEDARPRANDDLKQDDECRWATMEELDAVCAEATEWGTAASAEHTREWREWHMAISREWFQVVDLLTRGLSPTAAQVRRAMEAFDRIRHRMKDERIGKRLMRARRKREARAQHEAIKDKALHRKEQIYTRNGFTEAEKTRMHAQQEAHAESWRCKMRIVRGGTTVSLCESTTEEMRKRHKAMRLIFTVGWMTLMRQEELLLRKLMIWERRGKLSWQPDGLGVGQCGTRLPTGVGFHTYPP